MSPPKPAVLVVHGAYFLPDAYQPFIDKLTAAGFEVRCPRLPTCGDRRPPTATLADDVAVVQAAAKELQAAGHPTIVLAHSFGGLVATEAITKELRASPRNACAPGVVRLAYLCAYAPLPAQSLADIFARHGFQCDVKLQVNDDGTASAENPELAWYNDIPESKRAGYAKANVTHNFGLIGNAKVADDVAWKEVKSTYVYCDQDRSIHKPLQEAMVRDAVAEGGLWETVTLHAGHCPFLSVPDEVVGVVKDVWKGVQ